MQQHTTSPLSAANDGGHPRSVSCARSMQRGKSISSPHSSLASRAASIVSRAFFHSSWGFGVVVRQLRRCPSANHRAGSAFNHSHTTTVSDWLALRRSSTCCNSRAALAGDVEVERLLIGRRSSLNPGRAGWLSELVAEWAR